MRSLGREHHLVKDKFDRILKDSNEEMAVFALALYNDIRKRTGQDLRFNANTFHGKGFNIAQIGKTVVSYEYGDDRVRIYLNYCGRWEWKTHLMEIFLCDPKMIDTICMIMRDNKSSYRNCWTRMLEERLMQEKCANSKK